MTLLVKHGADLNINPNILSGIALSGILDTLKKFITARASRVNIQPALRHIVPLVEVDKVAFLLDFQVDPNRTPIPC